MRSESPMVSPIAFLSATSVSACDLKSIKSLCPFLRPNVGLGIAEAITSVDWSAMIDQSAAALLPKAGDSHPHQIILHLFRGILTFANTALPQYTLHTEYRTCCLQLWYTLDLPLIAGIRHPYYHLSHRIQKESWQDHISQKLKQPHTQQWSLKMHHYSTYRPSYATTSTNLWPRNAQLLLSTITARTTRHL